MFEHCLAPGRRARKRCLAQRLTSSPIRRSCFSLFQLERPSCRRSADLQPRPPPGRAYRPRPRPLLRPPAEGRSVRARPRSRPGSASGARSVWLVPPCCCGCEKAVAEAQPVETLQRPRRCPPPARAGRLEGWRRPCRDGPRHVLQPGKEAHPHPPAPSTPGVRRSWRRGRPRPRRRGCHPLRRRRPAGGWGRRAWPEEGGPDGGRGRQREARGAGAPRRGPARTLGAGEAGSGRGGFSGPGGEGPTGTRAVRRSPVASGEMPADFQEVSVRPSPRPAPWASSVAGGRRLGAAEPPGRAQRARDLWEGGVAARLWSRASS